MLDPPENSRLGAYGARREEKALSALAVGRGDTELLGCFRESRGAQGLRLFRQARGKGSDGITSGVRGERIPCVLKASLLAGMF